MDPLVSVVIPTHNRSAYVCQAIESALGQTYSPLEVIVVDNASTDGTREIVAKRFGTKLSYVEEEKKGPSAARNRGIAQAEGDYIAFLDSDDLWLPDKIASQVRKMSRSPKAGFCYTKCEVVDSAGLRTGTTYGHSERGKSGDNFRMILFRGPVVLPSVMVRREALTTAGRFDEAIDIGEDTALLLRLALYFPAVYLPETLTLVRQHGERKTIRDRRDRRNRKAGIHLFHRLLKIIPNDRPGARRLVARRLTILMMVEAESTAANWAEVERAVIEGYCKQLGTDNRPHLAHATASAMVAWYSRNQRTAKVEEIVETFAKIAQECEPDQVHRGVTEGELQGALLWGFLRRMAFKPAKRLARYLLRQRVASVVAQFSWSIAHSFVSGCRRLIPWIYSP